MNLKYDTFQSLKKSYFGETFLDMSVFFVFVYFVQGYNISSFSSHSMVHIRKVMSFNKIKNKVQLWIDHCRSACLRVYVAVKPGT